MGSSPTPVILFTFLYKVLFPLFWTFPHGILYLYPCYWPIKIQARWLSCLRGWFKASVNLVVWVRVLLLSFCLNSYIKNCFLYFEHLHMVSSTIIYATDLITYRKDGRIVLAACLRNQSFRWCEFEYHSCHFVDIAIQRIVSFIWTPARGIIYHNPCFWPSNIQAGWPNSVRS